MKDDQKLVIKAKVWQNPISRKKIQVKEQMKYLRLKVLLGDPGNSFRVSTWQSACFEKRTGLPRCETHGLA